MANREARGGTLIVGGGFAGSYAVRKLGGRGATIVSPENFMLFTQMLRLWALGDCAAVPNTATPGRVDPPTSQHALRLAKRLTKNIAGERRPYGYKMLGEVAALGRYKSRCSRGSCAS